MQPLKIDPYKNKRIALDLIDCIKTNPKSKTLDNFIKMISDNLDKDKMESLENEFWKKIEEDDNDRFWERKQNG